jgi:hypothetical protein
LVFWDSAFSLLICSWFGVSQSWSFWLLWGWVSDRCGGVRTITSESWGVEKISQVTQQPIEKVSIFVPTTKNPSHYQELVTALSNKYKVDIVVWADTEEGKLFLVWGVPVLEFLVVVGLGFG